MLRNVVLGFGLLVLAIGLALLLVQPSQAIGALVFGGLLTFGTLFERWQYKAAQTPRSARGQPTGERFVDPQSGDLMEVWYDPATGERSYVRIGKPVT
jgi:hypothetical protein